MTGARAPERTSRWRRPERLRRDFGSIGLLIALAVASGLLLQPRGDDGLIGLPDLQAGEIAPRSVRSSRSFTAVDPRSTAQAREVARESVRPVFDHLLGLAETPKARIRSLLDNTQDLDATSAAAALEEALGVELGAHAATALFEEVEGEALTDAASMLLDELFALPMVSEPERLAPLDRVTVRAVDADGLVTHERILEVEALDVLGPNRARARVDALAAEQLLHLPEPVRSAIAQIVKSLLTPNFVANAQENLRRRRLAWLSVKPSVVLVRSGERVLQAGKRMTSRDLLLVRELARLESARSRFRSGIGCALLGALLAWLGLRVARHGYRHRHPRERDLVFLASAFVVYLLLVWVGYKATDGLGELLPIDLLGPTGHRLLIPAVAGVMVVRSAAGTLVAVAATPICAVLAGFMMNESMIYATVTLVGGLAAATVPQGAKYLVLSAGSRAGAAQAIVVVVASLIAVDTTVGGTAARIGAALASAGMAAVLTKIALPVVEALFGYTTPSGLATFANEEHPLLRELLVEVPATYHHSLHVGALAEAGAYAIGADRILARVGGYFHDVGRLRSPSANEDAGLRSRRERARSRMVSTVGGPELAAGLPAPPEERRKNAALLASEHRFPAELSQIISEQPHELARSSELSARHPRPRSKPSALVFLADWVEDALRGREDELEDLSALEEAVRSEVRTATGLHLLDDSDLELRELAAIGQAFARALAPRFLSNGRSLQDDFRYAPPPPGAPS